VDRAAKRKRRKNLNLHDEIKESGGTVCAPHVGPWHQPNEDQQRPTVAETASGKDPVQESLWRGLTRTDGPQAGKVNLGGN
jgi:hypothetical protein